MSSNNIYCYYVYAYLNENGQPYYIGKGTGNRAYYGKHNTKIPKDKNKVIFLENHLSDIGACALERRYIRWYGRADLGTGILLNKTNGGEGRPKVRNNNISKKYKKQLIPIKENEMQNINHAEIELIINQFCMSLFEKVLGNNHFTKLFWGSVIDTYKL